MLELTATIKMVSAEIILVYHLVNIGDAPIYTWDQMVAYNDKGIQIVDKAGAYVFYEDPGVLRIVRGVLELPIEFDIAAKEIPFVRKIEPGETAEGEIKLATPVKEFSPFYPADGPTQAVKCHSVRLMVGWVSETEGMKEIAVPGAPDVMKLRGAWEGPVQNLAEVIVPAEVQLEVFTGSFDRRLPMH